MKKIIHTALTTALLSLMVPAAIAADGQGRT